MQLDEREDTYPVVARLNGKRVLRFTKNGRYTIGDSAEDLVGMQVRRTGYSVVVSCGTDGKPKLEYSEVSYNPHLPQAGEFNMAFHMNGFK